MSTQLGKASVSIAVAMGCLIALGTVDATAQTNWDQIHQQNAEASQRIADQQRQQQEAAQDGYMRQQEAQAAEAAQQQYLQPPQQQLARQTGWVDSYAAMAMSELHSGAWVAVNFTSKEKADTAALAACHAAVKEAPCKVVMGIANAYMALSKTGAGTLMADWGVSAKEAQDKIAAQCEKDASDCFPMQTYKSIAWRNNSPPDEVETIIAPTSSVDLDNRYAVIVWTSGTDMWAKSAWAASGHKTLAAAEAVALDRCQQDAGDQCKRATVANTYIAVGQDETGNLRNSVGASAERASERVMALCKKNQHRCTIIKVVSARESSVQRIELPRPWIGISFDFVDATLAQQIGLDKPRGALITEIAPDGPAALAGLQVGDVVLKYAGQLISESSEFGGLIGKSKIGESLTMETIHYGKPKTFALTPVLFGAAR